MAADLLSTIRAEIDSRLDELAPALAEYEELASVLGALAGDAPGGAVRRTRGRPSARGRTTASSSALSTLTSSTTPAGGISPRATGGASPRAAGGTSPSATGGVSGGVSPPRARARGTAARGSSRRTGGERGSASVPLRGPGRPRSAARSTRGTIGPTGQAILAALEHGSHTVAELVIVTALAAPDIREGMRRLRARQLVVKTERDGRTAYALPTG